MAKRKRGTITLEQLDTQLDDAEEAIDSIANIAVPYRGYQDRFDRELEMIETALANASTLVRQLMRKR
jgi:hypothetical protein